eukprot:m.290049 g.290049  ORF g.290049 m.290049 type:complete len:64 (-) comp12229_c0_seq1:1546-1737(-)
MPHSAFLAKLQIFFFFFSFFLFIFSVLVLISAAYPALLRFVVKQFFLCRLWTTLSVGEKGINV